MNKNVSAVGYFVIGEIDTLTPVAVKQLVNFIFFANARIA